MGDYAGEGGDDEGGIGTVKPLEVGGVEQGGVEDVRCLGGWQ